MLGSWYEDGQGFEGAHVWRQALQRTRLAFSLTTRVTACWEAICDGCYIQICRGSQGPMPGASQGRYCSVDRDDGRCAFARIRSAARCMDISRVSRAQTCWHTGHVAASERGMRTRAAAGGQPIGCQPSPEPCVHLSRLTTCPPGKRCTELCCAWSMFIRSAVRQPVCRQVSIPCVEVSGSYRQNALY
jgi:hypothetical protein